MEFEAHHEVQCNELRVKICVPTGEAQVRQSELKAKIVQTRQGFCRKVTKQTVA